MADDEVKVKKERDPILAVCFVVFLLTVCAITGASLYNNYVRSDGTVAVTGNTVSVDYIGTYYDYHGEQNAVVFDTSFWSVANDSKVPKSNGFTLNSESSYKALSFTVGGTTVLTGFGNSVIGHKAGDTVRVLIPAGEGYNAASTEVTLRASDIITIPAAETLTAAQFNTIYGFDLRGFSDMDKTVYGWPASASYNSINNTVTMNYRPQTGSSYTMTDDDFGKISLRVTSVSGSSISYTYDVSGYTVVSSQGAYKDIQMIMADLGTSKFYITSVTDANSDGVADTFTYKTVEERFNQDLYFEVKIVSIG